MPFPIDVCLIHPEIEACEAFRERFSGLPNTSVLQAPYEGLPPHDCFVTAGNSFGIMTAGIDAAVVRKHGEGLMHSVQSHIQDHYLGEQPIGDCFIVPTQCETEPFVAHSPTMRMPGSITNTDNVYQATWASFLAVYRHNLKDQRPIRSLVFPSMGTGFGGMSFDESARQMAAAYRHYLNPPHRMDWDTTIERHRAIAYDKGQRVVL